MGTDIHLQVERYDELSKEWIDINAQALSYRGTLNHLYEKPKEGEEKPKLSQEEIQDMIFEYWNNNPESRSYKVFSFLANVRNGYGFAGIETYQPIKPIENPRGFPSTSAFDEIFDQAEEWCHSFTHYSMKELLEHEGWNTTFHNSGYVPFDDWKEYVESQDTDNPLPCPSHYCGDVNGGNTRKFSMKDFKEKLSSLESTDSVYIKGKWIEPSPLKDSAFWGWLNSEKMTKLAEQYGSENIRINIYFDN